MNFRNLLLALTAPLALYFVHSMPLQSWIVDDAGISFAYARSLALGHGLVAQPGVPPVEGFTNLTWVLLVAATIKANAFDPTLTPKTLSLICVAVGFLFTGRLFSRSCSAGILLTAGALSITAATSAFVIWCTSGLENSLNTMLLAILALICAADPAEARTRQYRSVFAGLVLFLAFSTRPDGVLYFWILPFLLGLEQSATQERPRIAPFVWSFAVPWLLLTVTRLIYFGDVFPNTFYAKKGEGANLFSWLLENVSPPVVGIVVATMGIVSLWLVARGFASIGVRIAKRLPVDAVRRHVLLAFLATAILVHLALPGDWMPEYRFATPAFLFGPAAVLALLRDITRHSIFSRGIVAIATVVALSAAAAYSTRRTADFVQNPTISFREVCSLSNRIASVTDRIGPRVSVLLPDVGGALWVDRFRVVDLVGLTDVSLGRRIRRDGPSIRHHVLEDRKPEAIWLHSFWMQSTDLPRDPRFEDLYAPVWGGQATPGELPESGFYVRRDLLSRATGTGTK